MVFTARAIHLCRNERICANRIIRCNGVDAEIGVAAAARRFPGYAMLIIELQDYGISLFQKKTAAVDGVDLRELPARSRQIL